MAAYTGISKERYETKRSHVSYSICDCYELSIFLNKAASHGLFGYHPMCGDAKLTHICFADDLLIFTEGTLDSVKNILLVLREFEQKSGMALIHWQDIFFSLLIFLMF